MDAIRKEFMKINKLKTSQWVNPEFVTNRFSKEFGEKGLSWLDSDGSEHGKYSILGCNPKKVVSCGSLENRSNINNPFVNSPARLGSTFAIQCHAEPGTALPLISVLKLL